MFPECMGTCEVMAKLLCRCSMLKSDDIRLRSLTATNRWCEFCDLPEAEDARRMYVLMIILYVIFYDGNHSQ